MAILSSIFLSHTKFKTIAEQEDNLQRLILTTIFGIVAMVFIAYAEKLASHNETGLIERGNYLVTTMGCGDCHTPWKMGANGPEPDNTRLLSGHPEHAPFPMWSPADFQRNAIALVNPTNTAWAGTWGVSFTANLTPDTSTGIGEWKEVTFISAIRTGKHQGYTNARDILPPMPWPAYRNLTDEDLSAIWAYLRSIPPVKNQVPLPIPPGQEITAE